MVMSSIPQVEDDEIGDTLTPTIDSNPTVINSKKKNKTIVSKPFESIKDMNIPISLVSSLFLSLVLKVDILGLANR